MDLAGIAVAIGAINGLILIIKPVGRLHSRLDLLEFQQQDMAQDIAKILGASGITPHKRER